MEEGARDLEPPPVAAAQGARPVPRAIGQAEAGERVLNAARCFGARQAVQTRVEAQVRLNAQVQIKRRFLEHDTDPAQRCDGIAREIDAGHLDTSGVRGDEAGEHLHQRRLAGGVRPDKRDELALVDGEADVPHRFDPPAGLRDGIDDEAGVGHGGIVGPAGPGTQPVLARWDEAAEEGDEEEPVQVRCWITMVAALMCAGAAHAAGTGLVFVSHEKSDTVAVLDPAQDHAVVKEIATCQRPRDMNFDAAHERLYVACGDSDAIAVIDVATLEVVREIATGASPEIFKISLDGQSLYVSEEESAIVRQIDIETGETLMQIPTGPEPEGVYVMPDGGTIYFTSEVADMVHVVDPEQGEVVKNILVGTRPRRFELTEDGSELWVSDELAGQVTIIDTAANEVKEVLPLLPPGARAVDVTPVGLALSPDGETMFVALGRANHVAFVDVASKEVEEYVLVGARAWGVAPSPDGETLYVANGLSDDLSIVDVDRAKTVKSLSTGRVPHTVVVDD